MSTTVVSVEKRKEGSHEIQWLRLGGAVLGILAAVCFWNAPVGLETKAQQSLAIAIVLIAFWITEVLPHAITGLLGCWLFWSLGVVSPDVALGGFSSDAPWFLLGALFIGAMATES